MLVFMFPGQGSQRRGMGDHLFDTVPQFREIEVAANELLGFSVRQMCLEDPDGRLRETQFTQPCLYVVNALHGFKAIADGAAPDVFIGHSLGEYNALLAAGAFDLLTGLRIVKKRGELMAQARNGAMSAVLGLTPPTIAATLQKARLFGIDVANFNAPTQTVIAGPPEDLKLAARPLEEAGAKMVVPLNVSAAFHTRYMFEAARAFDAFLGDFRFSLPQKTVIANATAKPYPSGDPNRTVRDMLVRQIAHPVQWTRSIQYLQEQGAHEFQEHGPGNVLSKLIEQIRVAG